MIFFSYRTLNLLGSLVAILLLAFAVYVEYAQGLNPCSLCILQRLVYAFLGIMLFLVFLCYPKRLWMRIFGLFTILIALLGAFLAGRQVWLQLQPHATAEICMPGFSYIIAHLPWQQALQAMLQGADNCDVVDWVFLGWSMARWSLLCFIGFMLLGIYGTLKRLPLK